MTFKIHLSILPHPELLDPQGKAVTSSLHNLGITTIKDMRIGKHIVLMIEAENETEALKIAHSAADKLLCNPIMENYTCEVEK